MKLSDDYSDMHIEHNLDWAEGSNQHKRYEHVDQDQKIAAILRANDIEADEDELEPEWQECPQCQRDIPYDAKTCPYCNLIVDDAPAGWYPVYRQVAEEDDPIVKKYRGQESVTPHPRDLNPTEWNTVRKVLDDLKTALEQRDDPDHPDTEIPIDDDIEWEDIMHLRKQFGTRTDHYARNPEDYQMIDNEIAENLREQAIDAGIIETEDE